MQNFCGETSWEMATIKIEEEITGQHECAFEVVVLKLFTAAEPFWYSNIFAEPSKQILIFLCTHAYF
jgi:hypothetical protein